MSGLWNIKHFPLYSHTMIVIGPEHARTFGDDGWRRADLIRHLFETVTRALPDPSPLPDADNGEGTNLRFSRTHEPNPDDLIPKFPSVEDIHVVVAGGTAGRFSMAIPGGSGPRNGSAPVTVAIREIP